MRPGSLTPNERQAYRAARKALAVVKVRNAICLPCIRRAIGRPVAGGWHDVPHDHSHMTHMCPNARFSADTARMRRAELTLALAMLKPIDPDEKA